MDESLLLRWMLLVVLILVGSSLTVIFGSAVGRTLLRSRSRPLQERAESLFLLATVEDGELEPQDLAFLRGLPRRIQIRCLVSLATQLSGESHDRLSTLGERLGLVDYAERAARSRFWWRRLQAVRLFVILRRGGHVVAELIDDADFYVRAAAVEWAGDNPSPEVTERLVELLETPQRVGGYSIRDALLRTGIDAVPALARFLETREGASTLAALDVAIGLGDPAFEEAGLRLASDRSAKVRARVASLLGTVGGGTAIATLFRMLSDEDAAVKAAAAEALGRLGAWQAAPSIAGLLCDRAWIVRSHAGLALRRLGSPGVLLLRRTRTASEDPFAADMARQVLELPDSLTDGEVWS
jgi:hypothetical protein